MLREQAGYLSGQQICERLEVSRTAVWKAVNSLRKDGYEIEAVQNKGYRLLAAPDIISEEELRSRMKTKWAGRQAVYLEEVDSTNTEAKRRAEAGAPHGCLIVAGKQNAGKGRRGRGWSSPVGDCVYMSLLLRPPFAPDKAPMLTLVMALSGAQAVEEASGLSCGIKWPNDLVVNGKKMCGILTEMSTEVDYIHHVVIGVGYNVNNSSFPKELEDMATSLAIEAGRRFCRMDFIERTMFYFEKNYENFLEAGDMSALREMYEGFLLNKDRAVRVLEPGNEYEAVARGITATGELLVEKENGESVRVYAGEVSVRGIYGYV